MPVDDAELARLTHRHVHDLLTWLDDYPADQVNPAAVAAVRQSLTWPADHHPADQDDRVTSLTAAAGLLVDLMWWLDTCANEQVDSPDVSPMSVAFTYAHVESRSSIAPSTSVRASFGVTPFAVRNHWRTRQHEPCQSSPSVLHATTPVIKMLGTAVAGHLCATRPGLPVIYMSGYAQPALNAQNTLGDDAVLLEKPFTEARLHTAVTTALTATPPTP